MDYSKRGKVGTMVPMEGVKLLVENLLKQKIDFSHHQHEHEQHHGVLRKRAQCS